MERRLQRLEIGVLIVLLLNILILSIQIGNRRVNHVEEDIENKIQTKKLPTEFNETSQKLLLQNIIENYNNNNYDEFFLIFSEWAQLQISKESLGKELSKLNKISGKIIDSIYSYYEYSGFESGADWYYVYYKVKFENGLGTQRIKLRVIGANWEVVGINLTLDEI